MMKLKSLTMRNFMPYKGQVRVDFPQDEFQNVMLVFGDNMRGKTSLLNALRWGFYDRAVGRHSMPIPLHELPNKEAALEGDWTMEVYIEFEANGHSYELRRRAEKRASVGVPQRAEDFQTAVFLRRDGIAVQGDLVEAEINQIAPQQVSRFFLFDGELLGEYEMLLIEGSDQGRQIKEAIEQVLGVPALMHGRDETATLLKAARKTQQQDLQRVAGLEQHAQRQAELTSRLETFEKDLTALGEKLEATRSQRMTLDDEIDASQAVYTAKTRLDALKERRKQIEDYRDAKKLERLDILAVAWRDLVELKVGVRREQLEKQRQDLTQQMKREAGVELQIAQMNKLLGTKECPTCHQEMGESLRDKIGAELGRLQGELGRFKDNTQELQRVSAQIEALNKIRGVSARDRLAQVGRDLRGYEVELTKVENEAAKLEDEIAGYDTAEIARKRALRDAKLQEESNLQRDITNARRDLERVKGDLAVAQRTIEGLSQTRSRRSTVKATLCTQLESVFNQSIERLRDRLRETVQERATEAFKEMTTQKAYQGLEINQGYGLSILDERGHKVRLRSAGAEQVVALSLIDGLNRTGRSVGPVVMDTPFGRLDLNHRDNILTYLPSVTSQFVLLVHSGEIRPETDLAAISPRVGAVYEIKEINPRHSVLERKTA
ncbi:MAG: AAA family ATPase [Isosphaeraceae bacterium]